MQGESLTLVTGATGFLGRRLCARLKDEGERVLAVGRHTQSGPWDEFAEADLTRDLSGQLALDGVTTIYHLAGRSHALDAPADNAADASAYRAVVVDGTRRLVEAAARAGVQRFIYMSSVKAMGEGNPPGLALCPMDEGWPHTPQGPYGLAKAEAEKLVLEAGFSHAVVLRPVMVFGPGEKGNLPRMVNAVRKGRFPPIPENGNRRSMIHVDDVVEFAIRAARFPIAAGKTYILAAPEALSTRQLYDAIRVSLRLEPRDWSIPHVLLQAAATCGSLTGTLLGRRMPFDRDTYCKLGGSAWYSAARAERELRHVARYTVRGCLESDSSASLGVERSTEL